MIRSSSRRSLFALLVPVLMAIAAGVMSAAQPAHLYHADYNMEWLGPRSSGDTIVDGFYQFRYTWRFGILNDPMGVLDNPTISVDTALSGLTPQQAPNVTLSQGTPGYRWVGPQLAPSPQPGNSFFTALISNIPVPVPYALGFDAMRSVPAAQIPAGASETRTFTLTMIPRDPTLTGMGGSMNFDLFQPAGPVVASNLTCSSADGTIEMLVGGRIGVAWHIQGAISQTPLVPGTQYTMTCSATVTNTGNSPASFAPDAIMSGRRNAAPVITTSTGTGFTTDPGLDPWDPLGTVQFDVTAPGLVVAQLDRRFTRVAFFEGLNRALDVVPPVTTATTQPLAPNGSEGWFRSPSVGVSLSAMDNPGGTGVASITYSMAGAQTQGVTTVMAPSVNTNVSAPGVTTITYQAIDRAGNVEALRTLTVKRDSLPPSSSDVVSPAPQNGWNRTPATVTITGSDATSGVRQICTALTGATTQPQTCVEGAATTLTIGAPGITNVSYFAIDAAGNVEGPPRFRTVRIDTAPPVTHAIVPPPGPFGWYDGDVLVTLSSSDNFGIPFSGVAGIRYSLNGVAQAPIAGLSGSFLVSGEGTTVVTFSAEDRAGNIEAVKSITFRIIRTEDGFVTGGGTVDSAAGSVANFGFNAKYRDGIASGETEFQVKALKLNFHSTGYDWVLAAGPYAMFQGSGTVNGGGDYGFRVTVADGRIAGTGTDYFRIRIWDRGTGAVIYDTDSGAPEYALPSQPTATGNIVIHK